MLTYRFLICMHLVSLFVDYNCFYTLYNYICSLVYRRVSYNAGHSSDPSNFWEIEGTTRPANPGKTPLFPSPMPTFRSDSIQDTAKPSYTVDPTAAARGVVRIAPTADFVQQMGRDGGVIQQDLERGRTATAASTTGMATTSIPTSATTSTTPTATITSIITIPLTHYYHYCYRYTSPLC